MPLGAGERLYRGNTIRFGRVWVKGGMVVIPVAFGCKARYFSLFGFIFVAVRLGSCSVFLVWNVVDAESR